MVAIGNQRKAAVVLTYATQFVKILSSLLYTPLMIRTLGQSEYGTYQLVNSVVAYLGLFSLGFGAAYTRFYMRYTVQDDDEGVAKLNGMFLIIFIIIAVIAGSCGCYMIYNIHGLLGNGLTSREYEIATVLMKFMVFNLALSLFSSVFDCIITAHEQFVLQKTVSFFQTLFNPLITLPLLLMGVGSIGMVAVSTGLNIAKFIISVAFCLKRLHVKFSVKGLHIQILREIWGFTFFIFLNQIIDQITWNLDKFLLGRMSGTISVAVYGVAGQLNSMYLEFSGAVSGPFAPKINRIVADGDDDRELSRLFIKVGRIQALLLFLIISGYIFFGKAFIILWGGREYGMAYYVGLFLMVPVTVALIQNIGIEIQRAKNRHKIRSAVYFAIAIGNVLVSIPLIKAYGAVGAAAGTAISYIPGSIFFMNIYYHRVLRLDIPEFWRQIGRIIVAVAPAFGLGIALWLLIDIGNWIEMVLLILVYSALYCACAYLWGMNKEEKELVGVMLDKIGIRKK
jgi:O-antigen/teichoic acid export membrane protein